MCNKLKTNSLALIDDWILEQVHMGSDHAADSAEARFMKELLKMEKSPFTVL